MTKQANNQQFIKIFNKLAYRFSPWEVWKDFIVMFACAISNSLDKTHYEEHEALYLKTIQKYNKEERAVSSACSRNSHCFRGKSRARLSRQYIYESWAR